MSDSGYPKNMLKDKQSAEMFQKIMSGDVNGAVSLLRLDLGKYREQLPDCTDAITRLESVLSLIETRSAEYKTEGIEKFMRDVADGNIGKPIVSEQYTKLLAKMRTDREKYIADQKTRAVKNFLEEMRKKMDALGLA